MRKENAGKLVFLARAILVLILFYACGLVLKDVTTFHEKPVWLSVLSFAVFISCGSIMAWATWKGLHCPAHDIFGDDPPGPT